MVKFTAILPMKANSVRVPRKNTRSIAGKPLFEHVLATLSGLEWVGEILVSTESEELAAAVLRANPTVRIHLRDPALSNDSVTMNTVLGALIETPSHEHLVQVHATGPLMDAGTLSRAREDYLHHLGIHDSLFSVNRYQARFYDVGGRPINHDPANLVPTQELAPWYEENSCFYFFSRQSFAASGARIGLKPRLFVTPREASVDIDTEEDFSLAEKLLLASRDAQSFRMSASTEKSS